MRHTLARVSDGWHLTHAGAGLRVQLACTGESEIARALKTHCADELPEPLCPDCRQLIATLEEKCAAGLLPYAAPP